MIFQSSLPPTIKKLKGGREELSEREEREEREREKKEREREREKKKERERKRRLRNVVEKVCMFPDGLIN